MSLRGAQTTRAIVIFARVLPLAVVVIALATIAQRETGYTFDIYGNSATRSGWWIPYLSGPAGALLFLSYAPNALALSGKTSRRGLIGFTIFGATYAVWGAALYPLIGGGFGIVAALALGVCLLILRCGIVAFFLPFYALPLAWLLAFGHFNRLEFIPASAILTVTWNLAFAAGFIG
ncbi:MAG: hypothetical protein AAGJ54_04025 [Planctomycetota bacterium]